MRISSVGAIALGIGLAGAALSVSAQSAAVGEQQTQSSALFDWYGDLRLRGERTSDIPGRVDDLERLRASLRFGGRYINDSGWEFAAAAKLGMGCHIGHKAVILPNVNVPDWAIVDNEQIIGPDYDWSAHKSWNT